MNSKADSELLKGIMQGNLPTVVAALEAGADLEAPDVHGFSGFPLRMACSQGQRDIARELLRRGAQVHAANRDGPDAPLRLAKRNQHGAIVSMLDHYGALSVTSLPGTDKQLLEAPSFEVSSQPAAPTPDLRTADERVEYVEHLLITGCYGVDTSVLDGDLLRLSQSDVGVDSAAAGEAKGAAEHEPENKGGFKFWKR